MNLYLVTVRGYDKGSKGMGLSTSYDQAYVAAPDATAAYNLFRKYLDREDIWFQDDRELKSIELIASEKRCKAPFMFFLSSWNGV